MPHNGQDAAPLRRARAAQTGRADRFTGYRYYSAGQLPDLYQILSLKDLGLSLEQIRTLLGQGVPPAELRGMLRLKQAEIQKTVDDEQGRLARITARIQQLDQEETMPAYEVVIKEVPAMRVAGLRDTVADYGSQGPLWDELMGYVFGKGGRPAGPCLTVYFDEEYKESDVDLEVVQPIEGSLTSGGRVQIYDLPGADTMASTVHTGPYSQFTDAYAALMQWISANGYRITGPNREIYLRARATKA
ncbi:MAG: GyrI-like domain-containing protein [Caldilineales bacterium]